MLQAPPPPGLLLSCSINKKAYSFNKSLAAFISYLSNYSFQKKYSNLCFRSGVLVKIFISRPYQSQKNNIAH